MTPVRLEPAAPRSQVKHSTTEPLRSHISWFYGSRTLLEGFNGRFVDRSLNNLD